MLSKKLQAAVNDQISVEMNSALTYLSMSAYLESVNLPGIARWMRVQYEEETSHAMKFLDYMHDRGGRVLLQALDRPVSDFKSVLDIFQKVLEHEKKVTGLINKLYDLATSENDHATQIELQWFIKEQVEEEKTVGMILNQLKIVGDHGVSLMMLDRQLGARGSK